MKNKRKKKDTRVVREEDARLSNHLQNTEMVAGVPVLLFKQEDEAKRGAAP